MTEAPNTATRDGIQVLGLCRFSVPSIGAFQIEHDTIEERRQMLYDPARLNQRFIWFEHVLLPGIAAQKDKAFKLMVLLGEDFPREHLSRMHALTGGLPQIVLSFAPALHHRKICAAAMAEHLDPDAEVVVQFRLDDDDGVAIDFTRRLRRDFRRVRSVFKNEGILAIDYGKGFVIAHEGDQLSCRPRLASYWAPGLAICLRPDDGRQILDFEHHLVWQQMPTLTMSDSIMFLRGSHGTNDSRVPIRGEVFPLPDEPVKKLIRKRFAVDLDGFSRALGAELKNSAD